MNNSVDYRFDHNDDSRKASFFDDPSCGLHKNVNDFPILDSGKNSLIFDSRKNSCNFDDSIFIDKSLNIPSADISRLNNDLNLGSDKSNSSQDDKQGNTIPIYLY